MCMDGFLFVFYKGVVMMKGLRKGKRLVFFSCLLVVIYGVLLLYSYEPIDEQVASNPIKTFQSALQGDYEIIGGIALYDLLQLELELEGKMYQEEKGIKQTNFEVTFTPLSKDIPNEFINELDIVKESMEILNLSATLSNESFTIYPSFLYSEKLTFPIKISEFESGKVKWKGFRTIKSGKQRVVVSYYTFQDSINDYIYEMNFYIGKKALYLLEIVVESDKNPVLELQIKKEGCS